MQMHRKTLTFSIFCLSIVTIHAEQSHPFKDFLSTYVAPEQQQEFMRFYQKVLTDLRLAKQGNKGVLAPQDKNRITQLQQDGERFMHMKVAQLPLPKDNKSLKALCMRFGIYEEFLANETKKRSSFMVRAQSYCRGMTYKVSQWFGSMQHLLSRKA